MISIELSVTNMLALPVAAIYDIDDGVTTIAIFVGPFCLEVSWGRSR